MVEAEQDPAVAPSYRYAEMGYRHLSRLVGDAVAASMEQATMSLLVKARRAGRDIVKVTPQSAGWSYVGFAAHRLAAGESRRSTRAATTRLCLVVLKARVTSRSATAQTWRDIGERASVFEDARALRGLPARRRERRIAAHGDASRARAARPGRGGAPRA